MPDSLKSDVSYITIPIFPTTIYLLTFPTFEQCAEYIRVHLNGDISYSDNLRALTCSNEDVIYIMLPTETNDESNYLETFIHESLHATIMVLHYVGVPISFDNQESMAYLQQDIVTRFLPFLRKKFNG